jgi:NDP-sugar pyrophosphorylase family protein
MTVTTDHDEMNLQFDDDRLVQYTKSGDAPKGFNGYEAGTSVVKKSVLLNHGKEGPWSWENTIYPELSKEIRVHLDSTKFWDMGTPERLEKLEMFFNETRS